MQPRLGVKETPAALVRGPRTSLVPIPPRPPLRNLEMFKRSNSRYHSPFLYDDKNYANGRRDGAARHALVLTQRHEEPVRFGRAKRSTQVEHRPTAQRQISNRKYFAIFSLALPRVFPSTEPQPSNPNSNIRTIRILTNSRNITTYAFSNRNKIHLSAVCLPPLFSPRKGTSRDMIPALAPLP
jgi:hypothetical protein